MNRVISLALLSLLTSGALWPASKRYPATALVLKVDRAHRTFTASCSSIPGVMPAMVMPFSVRDPRLLDGIQPSMFVDFNLVVESTDSYAENIRVHTYENFEQEALRARRLELLDRIDGTAPALPVAEIGKKLADFALTDQLGNRVALSEFNGKVVAINFFYTSCLLPNYCFRLSNNLGQVRKRFASRMGKDLVLLSITFDPVHDQPDVLAKYAAIWKADPQSWHFLTGPVNEVRTVCRRFGVNVWPEDGQMTHSLHTVVIDRQGKLAANFEGNQFTAQQLGDFIQTELRPTR
jgi:protein SCO1/2